MGVGFNTFSSSPLSGDESLFSNLEKFCWRNKKRDIKYAVVVSYVV